MNTCVGAHRNRYPRRRAITSGMFFTACVLAVDSLCSSAVALPLRGPTPWAVLLCTPSDRTTVPAGRDFFERMFMEPARNGNLAQYSHAVSYGTISLSGTVVKGWYTMPLTFNQLRWDKNRGQVIDACIKTAKNSTTQPFNADGYRVYVVVNAGSSNEGPGSSGVASSPIRARPHTGRTELLPPMKWGTGTV